MEKAHGLIYDVDYKFKYQGYTLVDISNTGVIAAYNPNIPSFVDDNQNVISNKASWYKSRNQQRNWDTLVQVISLRAQPIELKNLGKVQESLSDYRFGSKYKGTANIWCFSFIVEHEDVFKEQDNATGKLEQDVDLVPVIVGLSETVSFPSNIFDCTSEEFRNIYFELIR